jgi:aryl-alcohol dehydrogenase-like predicted oxidoreductase
VSFVSVQPCYNLLFRQYERELLPLAEDEGLAVLPFNLLAGGLLSGKHEQSRGPTPGTRFTLGSAAAMYQDRYWSPESFDAVARIAETARHIGLPVATLAVAWVLSNPVITAAIVGASGPAQLDATLGAAELTLDPAVLDHLDKVTRPFRYGDAVE